MTLFISNLNTRASVHLALHTLEQNTSYPNYRLWVADSASTDGSVELLKSYQTDKPLHITASPVKVSHQAWLNRVAQEVTTPYWVAVDSDMLFTGQDWLSDMIKRLEEDPDLYLLAAERAPVGRHVVGNFVEGFIYRGAERVPVLFRSSFSSWLFCVRTALWDKLDNPTFAYNERMAAEGNQKLVIFDTGGQVIEQMDKQALRYAFMPALFRRKYYHYGNMSWFGSATTEGDYARLKRYQMKDVERRSREVNAG